MGLSFLTLAGCTLDNPAFDDCDRPEACLADESAGTTGLPGDGDPGDGDPGDGDGDGDPGDGDGDGEPGDGDGESGDGDGDGDDPNALPTCPETTTLKLDIVKDTFLVAAPNEGGICLISWDLVEWTPIYAESQLPCDGLDFGGADYHWICTNDGCNSTWLGRFNVGGWAEQSPTVTSAQVEFWADVETEAPSQVTLHPLNVDTTVFGQNCGDWSAGPGWGEPVSDCKTTYKYAAAPNVWTLSQVLGNAATLGAAPVPAGEFPEHHLVVPIATDLAQGWLAGDVMHLGVVLRSQTTFPTQLILKAQESAHPPVLTVEACSDS